MEDDVKVCFDQSEKRYNALEKRFDDLKWYFGGVTTLFTLGFSILTVVLSWNYNAEKAALRDFEKEVKAELGKSELPAELEIVGLNGSLLNGQEIQADLYVEPDKKSHYLRISHFLRNRGEGNTGPMFLKLYTSDPIRLGNLSTDEPKFKWEGFIQPENLSPKQIPGKFSSQWFHRFYLQDEQNPLPGKYLALLKVFYGNGKVAQAAITLVVPATQGEKR